MFESDYKRDIEAAEIMRCQWARRRVVESDKEYYKSIMISESCDDCHRRFICHTMNSKRYKIIENESVWHVYEVFAHDIDEAIDKLGHYGDDEKVGVVLMDTNSEYYDHQIEEWDEL